MFGSNFGVSRNSWVSWAVREPSAWSENLLAAVSALAGITVAVRWGGLRCYYRPEFIRSPRFMLVYGD